MSQPIRTTPLTCANAPNDRCQNAQRTQGFSAPFTSAADVHDWASNGRASSNIANRLPETVLGLDLDNYDGKPGLETMLDGFERLGSLPQTQCSTSRTDGASGIRFYRCRLVVDGPTCSVSVSRSSTPATGMPWLPRRCTPRAATSFWLGPDGERVVEPPAVDDLPDLPPDWVAELDEVDGAERAQQADVDGAERVVGSGHQSASEMTSATANQNGVARTRPITTPRIA